MKDVLGGGIDIKRFVKRLKLSVQVSEGEVFS